MSILAQFVKYENRAAVIKKMKKEESIWNEEKKEQTKRGNLTDEEKKENIARLRAIKERLSRKI